MNPPTTAPDWRLYLRMTRPGFLLITVVACLVGMATAMACGGRLQWGTALATVLLAVMAHAAGNVYNDFHDALNGADLANTQGLFPFSGGSRLIQQGRVSARDTQRWAWVLVALLVPAGLLLAVFSGGGLIGLGAVGLLLAWAYSAPPFKLMSRCLGELTVACAWWLVIVGADYVQRRHFFFMPWVVGFSYALLVANILLINGVPDASADARVGKRTLVVQLGAPTAAWLYLWLALLAHGGVVLSVWAEVSPRVTLWALVSLPLSLWAAWRLQMQVRVGLPMDALRPAVVLSIVSTLLHGLALTLAMGQLA